MNRYNAESVVKFWGGKDAAISLCRGYLDQSLTEDHKQRIMKKYHINLIFEALEFLEVSYEQD